MSELFTWLEKHKKQIAMGEKNQKYKGFFMNRNE
jgi:hypothetical protein